MSRLQTRNLPGLLITPQHMSIRNGPLSFEDGFMLTLSAQRQFIQQVLTQARTAGQTEVIAKLYDVINETYGSVLTELFPEYHNPHINDETIDKTIAAQDAFINQALAELQGDLHGAEETPAG